MRRHVWLIGVGGIGSELVEHLSAEFLGVSMVDMVDRAEACDLPPRQTQWKIDASDDTLMHRFGRESAEKYGPPEALIVAAGLVNSAPIESTSLSMADELYRHNLRLVLVTLQTFKKFCNPDPSQAKNIVVISSNAGQVTRTNQPFYAAIKAGIISLAKSAAVAWGPSNFKVNIIAPGTVVVPRNYTDVASRLADLPHDPARPLGRVALPADLVGPVRLLLDTKTYMTGQVLTMDGGSSL